MRRYLGIAGLTLLVATGAACAPAELSPDQIVTAFIAASQVDARTYHLEWRGTIHSVQQVPEGQPTQTDATLNATFEFSGADYEGVFTINSSGFEGGVASTTSYAQVGGVNFERFEGGKWQRIEAGAMAPLTFDPLADLTANDIAYEVADTLDLKQVHRLRVADPLGILRRTLLPAAAFGEISPVDGGASDYIVYVDAQGIPVAAHLRVDVHFRSADPNSTAPEIRYGFTSEYEFSDWGADIIILAPSITGDGGIEDKPPLVP